MTDSSHKDRQAAAKKKKEEKTHPQLLSQRVVTVRIQVEANLRSRLGVEDERLPFFDSTHSLNLQKNQIRKNSKPPRKMSEIRLWCWVLSDILTTESFQFASNPVPTHIEDIKIAIQRKKPDIPPESPNHRPL